MKVNINTKVSEKPFGIDFTISFVELTETDLQQLLDRADKSLSEEIGATLITKSPLAALEVILLYFREVSGQDGKEGLRQLRAVYRSAVWRSLINELPPHEKEKVQELINYKAE